MVSVVVGGAWLSRCSPFDEEAFPPGVRPDSQGCGLWEVCSVLPVLRGSQRTKNASSKNAWTRKNQDQQLWTPEAWFDTILLTGPFDMLKNSLPSDSLLCDK